MHSCRFPIADKDASLLKYRTKLYIFELQDEQGGRPALKIYKSKWFVRFAKKERIADDKLCEAIKNAEKGLIDADYGDGLIKQRIARQGEGKSGGYRSIILFRRGERAFFVYGFAKSNQDNIDESDERDFKDLAAVLLNVSDEQLANLVESGKYQEVWYDGQN
jgi:hypothetical protein